MAASLDGVDVLVFTGGVGERSAEIRARTAAGLGFLGLEVDPGLNRDFADDGDISAAGATVRTLVIHAREDIEVARDVRRVVHRRAAAS